MWETIRRASRKQCCVGWQDNCSQLILWIALTKAWRSFPDLWQKQRVLLQKEKPYANTLYSSYTMWKKEPKPITLIKCKEENTRICVYGSWKLEYSKKNCTNSCSLKKLGTRVSILGMLSNPFPFKAPVRDVTWMPEAMDLDSSWVPMSRI